MKRILIVEDDPAILRGLTMALQNKTCEILSAMDGSVGYSMGQDRTLNLIILDLMLPNKNGRDICRDLRKEGIETPVLMLTSQKAENDKVLGLELGADDYVTKPFNLRELQARVNGLLGRNEKYREATGRAEALSKELEKAKRVQENLFPKNLPLIEHWEIAGCCLPSLSVGGDYYDVFEYVPGNIILSLGDVAGKGLGPALHMASVHSAVRNKATLIIENPVAFVNELNEYLMSTMSPESFITFLLCIIDSKTGRINYINCGHPDPIVFHKNDGTHERLSTRGLFLGMFKETWCSVASIELRPGDVFIAFSDGIIEAMNTKNEMYDDKRIIDVLSGALEEPVGVMLSRLIGSVEEFAGDQAHADDLTALIIRYGDQHQQYYSKAMMI